MSRFTCKPVEEMTDNDFVQEAIDGVLREAIVFFSSPRFRLKGDMERYFYHEEEVKRVMEAVPHPENLRVSKELNDDGTVFCWVIAMVATQKEIKTKRKIVTIA